MKNYIKSFLMTIMFGLFVSFVPNRHVHAKASVLTKAAGAASLVGVASAYYYAWNIYKNECKKEGYEPDREEFHKFFLKKLIRGSLHSDPAKREYQESYPKFATLLKATGYVAGAAGLLALNDGVQHFMDDKKTAPMGSPSDTPPAVPAATAVPVPLTTASVITEPSSEVLGAPTAAPVSQAVVTLGSVDPAQPEQRFVPGSRFDEHGRMQPVALQVTDGIVEMPDGCSQVSLATYLGLISRKIYPHNTRREADARRVVAAQQSAALVAAQAAQVGNSLVPCFTGALPAIGSLALVNFGSPIMMLACGEVLAGRHESQQALFLRRSTQALTAGSLALSLLPWYLLIPVECGALMVVALGAFAPGITAPIVEHVGRSAAATALTAIESARMKSMEYLPLLKVLAQDPIVRDQLRLKCIAAATITKNGLVSAGNYLMATRPVQSGKALCQKTYNNVLVPGAQTTYDYVLAPVSRGAFAYVLMPAAAIAGSVAGYASHPAALCDKVYDNAVVPAAQVAGLLMLPHACIYLGTAIAIEKSAEHAALTLSRMNGARIEVGKFADEVADSSLCRGAARGFGKFIVLLVLPNTDNTEYISDSVEQGADVAENACKTIAHYSGQAAGLIAAATVETVNIVGSGIYYAVPAVYNATSTVATSIWDFCFGIDVANSVDLSV